MALLLAADARQEPRSAAAMAAAHAMRTVGGGAVQLAHEHALQGEGRHISHPAKGGKAAAVGGGGGGGGGCSGGGVAINSRTGQPIRVACLPCHRARTSCDRDALAAESADGTRPPCSRCVRLDRAHLCVDRPPRKTTKVACVHCIRAKRSCGEQRPCKRCVDRGMADQCVSREVEAARKATAASNAAATAALGLLPAPPSAGSLPPVAGAPPPLPAPAAAPVPAAAAGSGGKKRRARQQKKAHGLAAGQEPPRPPTAADDDEDAPRTKRQRLLSFEGPAPLLGSMDLSTAPMLSFPSLQMQQFSQPPFVLPAAPPSRQSSVSRALAGPLDMPLLSVDAAGAAGILLDPTAPSSNPGFARLDSGERAMISAAEAPAGAASNDALDDWVSLFGGSDPYDSPPLSPSTLSSSDAFSDGATSTVSPVSPGSAFHQDDDEQ